MRLFIVIFCLLLSVSTLKAAKIDTLEVFSHKMNKNIKTVVVLPDAYENNTESFPVIYLLHGYSGDYKSWVTDMPSVIEYADRYNTILICPDGGYSSWYFDSPIDKDFQYESFISKDLVEFSDSNYRTIANKNGRAISGLSMGGHGALYLAIKHPDIWGAAGSTSGGVDLTPFPDNWEISRRLGSLVDNKKRWEQNTIINMVHKLKENPIEIIIDCGQEDFFYDVNLNLHQKLIRNGIRHDYLERPGGHNSEYWNNSIKYHFVFFNEFFSQTKEKS